ncbi:hypothetical protein, partial [Enterobacter hormaechei]
PSYPIFLWITWCKILFIVSDQNCTTCFLAMARRDTFLKNII